MKHIILLIALLSVVLSAQSVNSKLNGLRIHMHRADLGHSDGWNHLRQAVLEANENEYGFSLTISEGSNENILNSWANDLYKINNGVPDSGDIDILIFCQGEGDRNIGGGGATNPGAGGDSRYQAVRDHVKAGGVLIATHAAGGRELSWQGWTFIAHLHTDWFVDSYQSPNSNAGHYGANTEGTWALDDDTDADNDSSAYFVRKLMRLARSEGGYGQPEGNTGRGEWYHFNGGTVNEDGTGGVATHANNSVLPKKVRGNQGVPELGIGPAKVFSKMTTLNNYNPPGVGRPNVWGREVSLGAFDGNATKLNGRFVYFNPGHRTDTYSQSGGWWGDMYLSVLRWTVKDDLGCTDPAAPQYNEFATVNDGTCVVSGCTDPLAPNYDPLATFDDGSCEPIGIEMIFGKNQSVGKIRVSNASIFVPIKLTGKHSVSVSDVNGKVVYKSKGQNHFEYSVHNLASGVYLVNVNLLGTSQTYSVSVP